MVFLRRATVQFRSRYAAPVRWKSYSFILGIMLVIAASYIPARLTIAKWQSPQPQAVLALGGRATREVYAADLARLYPDLKVWVSSGLPPGEARRIFRSAGIADDRVSLDYRAIDTVTNFTTLVKDLERENIHHIYLITSDYHMARAETIATIVLGSHGIAFTPLKVPSTNPPENKVRVARDLVRSLLWLSTGYTGAELKAVWSSRRNSG